MSTKGSIESAIAEWYDNDASLKQIKSETAKEVGCASGSCKDVRTISPIFIGRSDLRMPYRALN